MSDRRKEAFISHSKTLLILSRLIYFQKKLSKHSKFSDDEDVLKKVTSSNIKTRELILRTAYTSNKLLIINTVLLRTIKRVHKSRTFFLSFNPAIISHLCSVKTIADELTIKRGSKTTH